MIFSKIVSFKTGPATPRTTMIGMIVAASILFVLTLLTTRMAYELDQTGVRVQAKVIQFIDAGDACIKLSSNLRTHRAMCTPSQRE